MDLKNGIDTLNRTQVQDRKDNLVQVGELDVHELTHFAGHRRKLIDLSDNAAIVASLTHLLLQRRWDDRFYCDGASVFIGLQQGGLFNIEQQSALNIQSYIARFEPWCKARFALVTAGVATTEEGSHVHGTDASLDSARAELQRCHEVMTPSSIDLDSVFKDWMMAVSRAHWIAVELGCVGSARMQLRIPPRMQILAPLPAVERSAVDTESKPIHDVDSANQVLVVESPNGDLYLLPYAEHSDLAEGDWIIFEDGAQKKVPGWYLVN